MASALLHPKACTNGSLEIVAGYIAVGKLALLVTMLIADFCSRHVYSNQPRAVCAVSKCPNNHLCKTTASAAMMNWPALSTHKFLLNMPPIGHRSKCIATVHRQMHTKKSTLCCVVLIGGCMSQHELRLLLHSAQTHSCMQQAPLISADNIVAQSIKS